MAENKNKQKIKNEGIKLSQMDGQTKGQTEDGHWTKAQRMDKGPSANNVGPPRLTEMNKMISTQNTLTAM